MCNSLYNSKNYRGLLLFGDSEHRNMILDPEDLEDLDSRGLSKLFKQFAYRLYQEFFPGSAEEGEGLNAICLHLLQTAIRQRQMIDALREEVSEQRNLLLKFMGKSPEDINREQLEDSLFENK